MNEQEKKTSIQVDENEERVRASGEERNDISFLCCLQIKSECLVLLMLFFFAFVLNQTLN